MGPMVGDITPLLQVIPWGYVGPMMGDITPLSEQQNASDLECLGTGTPSASAQNVLATPGIAYHEQYLIVWEILRVPVSGHEALIKRWPNFIFKLNSKQKDLCMG